MGPAKCNSACAFNLRIRSSLLRLIRHSSRQCALSLTPLEHARLRYMENNPPPLLEIEIIYAKSSVVQRLKRKVEAGTTIREAIEGSGILQRNPEISLAKNAVGIFSQKKQLQDVVRSGDRIEIYTPLLVDPKEARRRRAKKHIMGR